MLDYEARLQVLAAVRLRSIVASDGGAIYFPFGANLVYVESGTAETQIRNEKAGKEGREGNEGRGEPTDNCISDAKFVRVDVQKFAAFGCGLIGRSRYGRCSCIFGAALGRGELLALGSSTVQGSRFKVSS